MEIKSINNTMSFKNYTRDDLYRLEQKLDSLQYALNPNDLNSFAKGIEKQRRLPMPLGVPPYSMNGMMGMGMPPGPMGMYGMPPGPMGMPGMIPGRYGMYPPSGGMYPPSSMYGPSMGLPPSAAHQYCSPGPRMAGQPCQDIFCTRK